MLVNALGHNLTINEYMKASEYKYLFNVDTIRKEFDDRVIKNAHKKVGVLRFLTNAVVFFCGCKRKALR